MMEITQEIINSNLIINQFGGWIDFHDAEILTIKFERNWDMQETSIRLEIFAFQLGEIKENQSYERVNQCIVDIQFSGIYQSEINGFNHQNVIYQLSFGKNQHGLFCDIEPCYGIEGYIECEKIEILKIVEVNS